MSLPRNLLPLGRDFGFGNCDQTPREFSHLLKRRVPSWALSPASESLAPTLGLTS